MVARYAGIYVRLGKVFVHSEQKMVSGAHLSQDDAVAVSVDSPDAIGAAVRISLDAYRDGIPVPDWRNRKPLEHSKNLLKLAGVRSLTSFYERAKMLSVECKAGEIKITPWKRQGSRGEYVPIQGFDRLVPEACTDGDLGLAVISTSENAI